MIKVMHIYLLLIVNIFALNFLLHFLLIVSPCADIVSLSKLHLDSIYGMKCSCTSDINNYIYILYVCIYTVGVYKCCMYIYIYTVCVYIYCRCI